MGQGESKKKIQEEFEIHKVEDNGNTLLRNKNDQKDYLMRIVSCSSQNDLDRLKTLLESRAQIKNNHLLSLVQIKEKREEYICSIQYRMFLVLEYSFKNTALEIQQRTKLHEQTLFQESDLWSILYSCSTALHALYLNGVSHQCLTADQIFINKEGFVKVAEPLLFGLEKNHLEAMRTKEDGYVSVHLSPEIMNCLEDQNFFYYEKEKSDVFILAMIMVDLALLKNNYLYDVTKRKAHLDSIPGLLKRVGQRYSSNLTSILVEMLRIDSKSRPGLSQIIDRVEKCNNIGQDFTLETQSNLKSNEISSEKDHERQTYEKPVKYKELQIKQQYLLDQSSQSRPVSGKIVFRVPEQPSLSINQHLPGVNHHNFDGRVFNTTPQQSYYNTKGVISTHYFKDPSPPPPPSNPPPPPQIIAVQQPPQVIQFQSLKKDFDLYERSRSIDSVKLFSNQNDKFEQARDRIASSANKANPFNAIQMKPPIHQPPKKLELENKFATREPLFTHEIPEVYNIMIKNSKTALKAQIFSNHEKDVILDKEHVSTPQFNGEIMRVNRFTSFKNLPHETVSRFSDEREGPELGPLELRRTTSHTQSETHQVRRTADLAIYAREAQSPITFPSNYSFMPQHSTNPFAISSTVPVQLPPAPFSVSGAGSRAGNSPSKNAFNAISSVSCNFSPSKVEFARKSQSYTCRSGFNHLNDDPDTKLQYTREDIPDRGRYQGYKSEGQRNGHGTLYFKDGGHYEGEWKQDKMHGFGKLYYQNGTIAYEGHWENDEFNGQGRVYNMEPANFHQDFNYKDFSQLGSKWIYYDGQFKNDSKHGKGYIKLTNGEMFQGLFDHDMIEGNGIFYKRSGQIVIGFWIDNKLFLNQSYEQEKR